MKRIHVIDGKVDVVEWNVDAEPSNAHPFVVEDSVEVFGGYTSNGDGTFTAPPLPDPTADEVRAEASRRMVLMFGARDTAHLNILVSNATREAVKLLRKGPENWDTTEATRAAELEGAENALDYIRAKSNLLEVMDPIPQNYTDDSYWT